MEKDFKYRSRILIAAICVIFFVIIVRLFFVQIINDEYRINAENNSLKYVPRYPARGRIVDRNGVVIVDNKITYDFMVTPIDVKPFDTTYFCKIFDIDPEYVHEKFAYYKKYRTRIGFNTQYFLKLVSAEQYNVFVEHAFMFPGFTASVRPVRDYQLDAGGNLIGYVTEVDSKYIKEHPEYVSGDYAGRTGIEGAYEKRLRGQKGYNIYLRDARNRIHEQFEDGLYDKEAITGADLQTSIDAELQAYGQQLMNNKVGSLIAIEPSTGEILTLVSSPGVKMEQLANISKHYSSIINDPLLPMFNRAVQSPQPPGSVFKLVNALIALEEGVVTPETQYGCNMGFRMGGLKVGCHAHPSPLDLKHSIAMSCNAYYCYLLGDILNNRKNYRSTEEAFNKWNEYVHSFGFGEKLGSDIPHELGGYVPTSERYNRVYGKNAWKYLTIISLSIGQGEMGCTPLHLANLCATIANGGYYYRPHMIRASENYPLDSIYLEKQYTMVDTSHFRTIRDGMEGAVYWPGGTARKAQIDSIVVCGKTGTAQNPHGDDHSVFICFAPKDDPKIAIAAYVENGGFGATWAVPIASLLMEKYLKGEISDKRKWMEQYVMDGNLLHKVKKR